MAKFRIVDGQKVLVESTQRPAPVSVSAPAIPEPMAVGGESVVEEKTLAGLAPASHQVTEEPSNGG